MSASDSVRASIRDGMPQLIEDLRALVAIPSIAFPGFDEAPVLEAAELTAVLLLEAGCVVRMIELPGGPPAIFGEIPAPPGAPTVLLYAHYDIQPPGDDADWYSPPFDLTERAGRLYGRGAADNKAGICMHLAALRAFDGKPPVGIKVLVEGEEETGRSGLEEYVADHADVIAADVIVVADMGNWRLGEPTLTTSLRGVADAIVEVSTLAGPVHSGAMGGPAPDALMALIRALATLQHDDGSVALEGLVSSDWAGLDLSEHEYRQDAGILEGVDLTGTGTVGSRLWSKTSVNVIGIDVPDVHRSRNALVHMARAKVSLRYPPEQDGAAAREALVRHLERAVPWNARVTVTPGVAGPGFAASSSGPAVESARAALEEAYGKPSVEKGSGGSIPLVRAFADALPGAEVILWGTEEPACAMHAPNESVDILELERASLAEALLLLHLGNESG